MAQTPFHVLDTQARQNRIAAFVDAVLENRHLPGKRFDFLVLFSQFADDVLEGLSIFDQPFIQGLKTLQHRISLFPRLICLLAFFFDLVLELIERLPFLLDLVAQRLAPRSDRCGGIETPQDRDSEQQLPRPPHTFASPKRRKETKLPAQPSPIPTTINAK